MQKENFVQERLEMVNSQLKARGIIDKKVLAAMLITPRHLFVPEAVKKYVYQDRPQDIGYGQTISQPYIVAFMTESAMIDKDSKVLEVGIGSGYQAAILSQLCKEVYTIETVQPLAETSKRLLARLSYNNVHVRTGDGYNGWLEEAPFDAIIVTAAPDKLPQELIKQLKEGGRLIIPVGVFNQELLRVTRTKNNIEKENLLSVRFVPMVKEK